MLEATNQPEPVKLHHMHFFGEQNSAMRDQHVKEFGAAAPRAAPNAPFLSATLPGLRMNFSRQPRRRLPPPAVPSITSVWK